MRFNCNLLAQRGQILGQLGTIHGRFEPYFCKKNIYIFNAALAACWSFRRRVSSFVLFREARNAGKPCKSSLSINYK